MKYVLIWITAVLAIALLMVGIYFVLNPVEEAEKPQSVTTGQNAVYAAPDFTVIDGDGNAVKLSDLRGRPVVLNFWASWCPPCKAEMPDFEAIYLQYGENVVFMMVNLTDGQSETLETAKRHIADNGYTFPVYFDTQMQAASAYGIASIPQTFFINAAGELVTYAQGMISAEALEDGINKILE